MQLIQMTNDGTYWLKAENKDDALQIDAFVKDATVDVNHTRKIHLTCVTSGAMAADDGHLLPERITLDIPK